MKFIYSYWQTMTISTVFWCILNESFSPRRLLEGFIVAIIASICIHYLFKNQLDQDISYRLSIFKLVKLVFVLFWNIYVSSIKAIKIILFNSPSPTIVKINTKSTNPWHNCLISNSITLTPGTITIDLNDQELTVLWLSPTTQVPEEISQIILTPFESVLSGRSKA